MAVFIFLFLFMGGFAAAFSFFIGTLLFPDVSLRPLRRARNGALLATLVLPATLFGIFILASPSDAAIIGSLIPALWVFCMFLGITVGLTALTRSRRSRTRTS